MSRDVRTIDNTSLRVYFSYTTKIATIDESNRVDKKSTRLMNVDIVRIDIILKMKWFQSVNLLINFAKNTWRLCRDLDSMKVEFSNQSRTQSNDLFNVALIIWMKMKNSLSESYFIEMIFLKNNFNEQNEIIEIIDVIKNSVSINSNEKITISLFACYAEYANVFNENKTVILSKRTFHDFAIKTISNRNLLLESNFSLFQIELKMLRKYIDINLKKK